MQFRPIKVQESKSYQFIQVPAVLITDSYFGENSPTGKPLSGDAIILYSILLDRVGLSKKNNWIDNDQNVYVICTINEIAGYVKYKNEPTAWINQKDEKTGLYKKPLMNCSPKKAKQLFDELIAFNLVLKKRRGQGLPDLIYVNMFYDDVENDNDINIDTEETPLILEDFVTTGQDRQKLPVKTDKNYRSRPIKTIGQDRQKLPANQTNINHSIYIYSAPHTDINILNDKDVIEAFNSYIDMRIANGFVITDKVIQMLIDELLAVMGDNITKESALAIIKKATISGWKGFYPEEKKNKPPKEKIKIPGFANFEQRDTDYSDIEKKLINK